jgi:UDP:flavonoid glycosyltransferase YjiC (YdhE family)
MKVLFTTHPGSGHWHPLVPLARALETAGHEVAFATPPGSRRGIEAAGFRTFPAGADDNEQEVQRLSEEAKLDDEVWFHVKYVFAWTRARRSLPDLLDIIRDWRPDLVVRENTEFAGCVAAERAGIPHAALQITVAWTHFLEMVGENINRLRATVDLPPAEVAETLYRYLLLFPRPPGLWNPAVPPPATMHPFRYTGFSQSGEEALPAWVAELEERPTIYATMGTDFNSMTEILSAILAGLGSEPVNLILTIGRDRNPEEFGPQPDNVHVERYIPQNLVLPYCDLVVCHGGSGTVMDAVSHGLPMVIIPIGADQPDNAQICAQAGVARIVQPSERTAANIRRAAREVLSDPAYTENVRRLRGEIEELPGLDHAAELLQRLAVERAPLIA